MSKPEPYRSHCRACPHCVMTMIAIAFPAGKPVVYRAAWICQRARPKGEVDRDKGGCYR